MNILKICLWKPQTSPIQESVTHAHLNLEQEGITGQSPHRPVRVKRIMPRLKYRCHEDRRYVREGIAVGNL